MTGTLERIADALERIARALEAGEPVTDTHGVGRATDQNAAVNPSITVEVGPHAWDEVDTVFSESPRGRRTFKRVDAARARRGIPLRCGRCRREGRSRMNNSDRCRECQHEDWWDE